MLTVSVKLVPKKAVSRVFWSMNMKLVVVLLKQEVFSGVGGLTRGWAKGLEAGAEAKSEHEAQSEGRSEGPRTQPGARPPTPPKYPQFQ